VSQTSLCKPSGIAVDSAGNLFVADRFNNRVLQYNNPFAALAAKGIDAGFAASVVLGQSGNFISSSCNLSGSPTASTLCLPAGVALDPANNLYVADQNNNRVLEYKAPVSTGQSAHLVFGQLGSFTSGTHNKGGVSAQSLSFPTGVRTDSAGNLYVADLENSRVLEYNTPLKRTAVKGSGDTIADLVFGQIGSFTQNITNNGGPSASTLSVPNDVVIDTAGNVYIADTGNSRALIYKPPLGSNPTASAVLGQADDFGSFGTGCNIGEPFPSEGTLCRPIGIAVDSSDNIYVSDSGNNRVLKYEPPLANVPFAQIVVGQPDMVHSLPNAVDPTAMNQPMAIAVDHSVTPNHLYIADTGNHRVLGYKSVFALVSGAAADLVIGQPDFYSGGGNQLPGFGNAGRRTLFSPIGIAVDGAGNLFVADSSNNRVLGFLTPYNSGFATNEPAAVVFGQGGSFTSANANKGGISNATLFSPTGVAFDSADGRLYVVDNRNNRALVFAAPFGGNPIAAEVIGQSSFAGSNCDQGGITRRALCHPEQDVVDNHGNLYVADNANARVLEYDAPIGTDAGASLVFGQSGSCSAPSRDTLCGPSGIGIDLTDNVYIADANNSRVLEYNTPLRSGTTADLVFGQNNSFTSGSCNHARPLPSASTLCLPNSAAVDSIGNLYVADTFNNRVLEYDVPVPSATATRTTTRTPANTRTANADSRREQD